MANYEYTNQGRESNISNIYNVSKVLLQMSDISYFVSFGTSHSADKITFQDLELRHLKLIVLAPRHEVLKHL